MQLCPLNLGLTHPYQTKTQTLNKAEFLNAFGAHPTVLIVGLKDH